MKINSCILNETIISKHEWFAITCTGTSANPCKQHHSNWVQYAINYYGVFEILVWQI